MNLRLPKSNLAWTVRQGDPLARGELIAEFTMPNGEVLRSAVSFIPQMIEDTGYADHMVRAVCEEIAREVGRRLVMGDRQ